MKLIFQLILILLSTNLLFAQNKQLTQKDYQAILEEVDSLESIASTIVNDSIRANRVSAVQKFLTSLKATLDKPHSFQFPFKGLKSVSIQYPADSSFRIFTLQLYIDNNAYEYFGVLQMNTEDPQLIELKDASAEIDDPHYDAVGPQEWYGALYYNIEQFKDQSGKTQYLLFGYDAYSFFQKRKIVDVLTLDKNGQLTFGSPVFTKTLDDQYPDGRKRILLQYTAEAAVRIQFDPAMKMIVHDHLIPMRARYGETNIPDGSYVGYQYKSGLWRKVDKIWHQVSEEAPREMPILNGRDGKDLFGN